MWGIVLTIYFVSLIKVKSQVTVIRLDATISVVELRHVLINIQYISKAGWQQTVIASKNTLF